ncbi:MAG: sulfotransferase family protein [Acidimicrobiales bacterium]|jgi:hypothetical protein
MSSPAEHEVDLNRVREVVATAPIFVLGAARSGTTLLGVILDAHPSIDISYETAFVTDLGLTTARETSVGAALDQIVVLPSFKFLGLDAELVRDVVAALRPADFAELARAIFALGAVQRGKHRWGDKTPRYAFHLLELHKLFPDAVFIHIIRDMREAASSVAEMDWGPDSVTAAAFWVRSAVRKAHKTGMQLPHAQYTEIRLEDLIASPEASCRRLCEFLGVPFDDAMLRYHETGGARIPSQSKEHPNVTRPPTGDLRDWRRGLGDRDISAVETLLRSTLSENGYEIAPSSLLQSLTGWAWVAVNVAAAVPRHTANIRRHLARSIGARKIRSR